MSLLRLLPAIRPPIARRACVSACYSTVPTSTAEAIRLFEDAIVDHTQPEPDQNSLASASTTPSPSVSSSEPASASIAGDDEPPTAPEGSYRRTPAPKNPVTVANEKSKKSGHNEKAPMHAVSVKSTRNNTIVTFARPGGNQLVTLTGGKLGFKKSNRNGYEAGYQCAVGIIGAIEKEMDRADLDWELFLNGFGQGRDAMLTALTTAVGEKVKSNLKRITDKTPLKIGGTRGQKTRRV